LKIYGGTVSLSSWRMWIQKHSNTVEHHISSRHGVAKSFLAAIRPAPFMFSKEQSDKIAEGVFSYDFQDIQVEELVK
jgi:hypothetical protein